MGTREAAGVTVMCADKCAVGGGVVLGWDAGEAASAMGFTTGQGQQRAPRRKLLVDDGDGHVLVVAPTGSGKGRSIMIPTLLTCAAPAVVIDVKGEAAAVTARARREMGHDVRIIDPFRVISDGADGLNPLDVLNPGTDTFEDDALTRPYCACGYGRCWR